MATGIQNGWPSAPLPFRQTSPQTLELREGGGWLTLLGLPFFLGGCCIGYTLVLALNGGLELRGAGVPFAFAAMSCVFLGIGAVLMLGRRWTVLDVSRGVLVRSFGLLVPLKTQERPLSEFNAVVLAYNMGDSDSPETYPVKLRAVTGPEFNVRAPQKFGDARLLAEYLSGFLRLSLVDTVSDHERVMAPGGTAQTLHEQLPRTDIAQPGRPANLRSQITESGVSTTIVIPGAGGLPVHVLGIVLPLLVLLVVMPWLHRALGRAPMLPSVGTAVFLVLAVVCIPPLLFVSAMLIVRGNRKRTTVVASPAGLEIEQSRGWSKQRKTVAAADLLDVDTSTIDGAIQNVRAASASRAATQLPDSIWWVRSLKKWVPTRGIVVKSRQELISFGEGLPADELQYLSAVLRKALSGR